MDSSRSVPSDNLSESTTQMSAIAEVSAVAADRIELDVSAGAMSARHESLELALPPDGPPPELRSSRRELSSQRTSGSSERSSSKLHAVLQSEVGI